MRVSSSIDAIDFAITEALEERSGQPVRLRVQPQILRVKADAKAPMYLAWRGLHWSVELGTIDEARKFREALAAFFFVAEKEGVGVVRDRLLAVS